MLCEKILGNIKNTKYTKAVETVDFEWHELYKKLHKKTTSSGEEIGIRLDNDILKKGLRDGDILFEDDSKIVVVNILPCETIIVDVKPDHLSTVAKVCYEIGNRHATLLHGDGDFQFLTPYTAPMKEMLEKIHGTTVHVDTIHLDFNKSISSTVNNHTH